MKTLSWGVQGTDAKTSLSIGISYSATWPSCLLCPGAKLFQKGQKFLRPSGAILPLVKIFLPPLPPLKIKSAADEKNPGHTSAYKLEKLFYLSKLPCTYIFILIIYIRFTQLQKSYIILYLYLFVILRGKQRSFFIIGIFLRRCRGSCLF